MPRVANLPRVVQGQTASPQKHASIKMPLNDDRQEKAIRLQSRQALHDMQMNQIKAAASPTRNLSLYERIENGNPQTPRRANTNEKENFENGGALIVVTSTAVTPMKRVPILANFEEWMKMATDNKINATNSWNFALIDYFHDMSLLKEGDGVNFQKASCTLDGCVKIYTSRVDSVATETGKLLSGLADSGNKKNKRGEEVGEDDDNTENEENEDGVQRKAKKRAQRSFEATLAPSFAPLSLKKFELEFSVDPLFKKASADFDEGGAKGLLLNHLAIDAQGRIVFDSSDDSEGLLRSIEVSHEGNSTETACRLEGADGKLMSAEKLDILNSDVDLSILGSKFFPDLDRLDTQDICPSLKNLNLGESCGMLDLPFLKPPEDGRQDKDAVPLDQLSEKSEIFLDDDNAAGFEDDIDAFEGLAEPANTGFGEGGEAWARDAALEPQVRAYGADSAENLGEPPNLPASDQAPGFSVTGPIHTISTHRGNDMEHGDILSYFDNALQKNWAGPEHWKIRKVKGAASAISSVPIKRKEKEVFEIDFASPLSSALADLIYTPATSTSAISLPKASRVSKTRNLLPDDKHFNSRQLLQLFLKPKARIGNMRLSKGTRRDHLKGSHEKNLHEDMDERFWAQQQIIGADRESEGTAQPQGNYDANFFQDDGLGFVGGPAEDDDDFADAREAFSPGLDGLSPDGPAALGDVLANSTQEGAFGSQLVTQSRKLRPDYVQYARVAKKVDVRRLKQEMWKGLEFEGNQMARSTPAKSSLFEGEDNKSSKFTSIMNSLQQVYPKPAMADISTSYCFICLLHLANEKGLTISDEEGLEELAIRRDLTAEITDMAS